MEPVTPSRITPTRSPGADRGTWPRDTDIASLPSRSRARNHSESSRRRLRARDTRECWAARRKSGSEEKPWDTRRPHCSSPYCLRISALKARFRIASLIIPDLAAKREVVPRTASEATSRGRIVMMVFSRIVDFIASSDCALFRLNSIIVMRGKWTQECVTTKP